MYSREHVKKHICNVTFMDGTISLIMQLIFCDELGLILTISTIIIFRKAFLVLG